MDTKGDTARDGGWGAVLDGVEGANPVADAAAMRRDGWDVIGALADRSSGGDATADDYARIVAQIGTFVPSELRDAAETLLHVAGGTSSWTGAVIDAAPRPPDVASTPDVAAPPDVPRPLDVPSTPEVPSVPRSAGPGREPASEPAPTPEREPTPDDTLPDDPTFEAAIAAAPSAEHSSEVTS